MALKQCNPSGCSSIGFQDAIVHAANNGADVISISFCYGWDDAWVDAVNTARAMGTLTVASLGNATTIQACVPATVPEALAIGGTDRDDERIFAQGTHHFVSAPGEGIYSTSFDGSFNPIYSTGFGGTSASAPFVAGIVGLVKSHDPALRPFSRASTRRLHGVGGSPYAGSASSAVYGWIATFPSDRP